MPKHDSGYGWTIVAAFFLTEIIIDGIRLSFGILFVDLLYEFKTGKGETALTGSIITGVLNMLGPLFAVVVNKFGCRASGVIGSLISTVGLASSFFVTTIYQLYLTYGVLLGIGFGLMYISGSVSICRYFVKKRTLAYGIACCGSGIGTFIFTPICTWLLDTFGLRGTLLIFAGVSLNGTVLSLLYRPNIELDNNCSKDICKDSNNSNIDSRHEIVIDSADKSNRLLINVNVPNDDSMEVNKRVEETNKNSFANFAKKVFPYHWITNPTFILLMVSLGLFGIPAFLPFILLPDYGIMVGCSNVQSSWFVSALGIAGTIGRVVTGLVADIGVVNKLLFQGVIVIAAGLLTACIPWMSTFPLIMAYSVVYGLLCGGIPILQPMILLDYFGEDGITEVMGIYMFVAGIGTLIGPPIAGWLFDITGKYTLTFTVASSLSLIAGIVALSVMCLNGQKKKSTRI